MSNTIKHKFSLLLMNLNIMSTLTRKSFCCFVLLMGHSILYFTLLKFK